MVQQGGVIVVKSAAAAAAQFVSGSAEVLSLRTTSGTPPRVQRAFCNPCCKAGRSRRRRPQRSAIPSG